MNKVLATLARIVSILNPVIVLIWIAQWALKPSVTNEFIAYSAGAVFAGTVVVVLDFCLKFGRTRRMLVISLVCLGIITMMHLSGAVCLRKKSGGCIPVVDGVYEFWFVRTDPFID